MWGSCLFWCYVCTDEAARRQEMSEELLLLNGARVQELRVAKGLSQKQLAQKADLQVGYLSQIELMFAERVTRPLAVRMAEALEVALEQILRIS